MRLSGMSSKVIGTHSGSFHCDEALACFMLRQTEEFRNAKVVRTRDAAVLDTLDIVVDVGGVYDPSRHRYDHHQRGFEETFGGHHDVKLSSAGLVYKHFGREVVANISGFSPDNERLETMYQQLYGTFVRPIDAIDNGVDICPDGQEPRYKVTTDLGSRVGRLNPNWNETGVDADERFERAVKLTGEEFTEAVNWYAMVWLPARDIVESSMRNRPHPQVVVLEQFTVWGKHLFDLEKTPAFSDQQKVLYVVFQDSNGSFRVRAVSESAGSFASRKALPEPWRGLRDDALSTVCGVDGCIFAHATGFIGGNKTLEGAVEMARRAIAFDGK